MSFRPPIIARDPAAARGRDSAGRSACLTCGTLASTAETKTWDPQNQSLRRSRSRLRRAPREYGGGRLGCRRTRSGSRNGHRSNVNDIRSIDAVFEMAERDGEVGGAIIAGALAYRLFIWLLPLALIAVAGLGFAADASSESPEEAAESLGLQGLISSSIANAANSPNRWYALLIGVPVLIWATRSVLRVLIGAHRLVWTDDRTTAPKPKLVPSLRLLALFLCFGVVSAAASALRVVDRSRRARDARRTRALCGFWLLVTVRLPHRDAPWTALIPGAAVFALGLELLHAVLVYVITPWALAKQGTYGALGVAAALLVGLFLISRLVVAAAVVNATLWEASPAGLTAGCRATRFRRHWLQINPLDARARPPEFELPLELVEAPFDQLPVAQFVLQARRRTRVSPARRMST